MKPNLCELHAVIHTPAEAFDIREHFNIVDKEQCEHCIWEKSEDGQKAYNTLVDAISNYGGPNSKWLETLKDIFEKSSRNAK